MRKEEVEIRTGYERGGEERRKEEEGIGGKMKRGEE